MVTGTIACHVEVMDKFLIIGATLWTGREDRVMQREMIAEREPLNVGV